MKGSKVAFLLLSVNLLVMYLIMTMQIFSSTVTVTMLFLNIPLVILLFLVRENILEFLKYMVYLVLMTVVYNYVEPYISYRGEAHLKKIALIKKHQESCMSSIINEVKLKEKMKLWEDEINQDNKNNDFRFNFLDEFKVILYFIDINNTIDTDINIDELADEKNITGIAKANLILETYTLGLYDIEKAIKNILTLKEEERSIYKSENICYLSQKYELMNKIKKEGYEDAEVRDFLFETCEGY